MSVVKINRDVIPQRRYSSQTLRHHPAVFGTGKRTSSDAAWSVETYVGCSTVLEVPGTVPVLWLKLCDWSSVRPKKVPPIHSELNNSQTPSAEKREWSEESINHDHPARRPRVTPPAKLSKMLSQQSSNLSRSTQLLIKEFGFQTTILHSYSHWSRWCRYWHRRLLRYPSIGCWWTVQTNKAAQRWLSCIWQF